MRAWLQRLLGRHDTPPSAPTAKTTAAPGNAAQVEESTSWNARGDVHFNAGRFDEAADCYRTAISLNHGFAEAHDNLGLALWQQKQYPEAEQHLKKAISIAPGMVYSYYNLASMLYEAGKPNEALPYFIKALELKPDFAEAHNYLGVLFGDIGQLTESVASYREALRLDPHYCTAKAQMVHQQQHLCEWNSLQADAASLRRAITDAPEDDRNLLHPFTFVSLPGTTAEEQRLCAERFVRIQYQALTPLRRRLGFGFNRPVGDKIRVGYLSGDLRQHPVAVQMAQVFELHDRSRFHTIAYSYGDDDGSAIRRRVEQAFDDFVDIRPHSHEEAARRIYADRIDILVDLTGHTKHNRSGMLILRPAPVQVNFLGYPGTMGADFIDYLIADKFVIPPEHRDCYTEKVVWMPDSFMPTDRTRPRPAPPSRQASGLPEHGFVFCCFNQSSKITPEVFDVWCRLLTAVPESVLWLPAASPQADVNLRREAEARGVEGARIILAPRMPEIEAHLARLQCADLFLDTLPYNAHATCGDALWMGVPVVTCAGNTFASRVAGSLLSALRVPELITYNLEDYYRLALDLATHRDKLAALRSRITANRETAPLFDSLRFTRNLEDAYAHMLAERAGNTDLH